GIVMLSAFVAALLLRPLIDQAPVQPVEGLRGLGLARRAAGLCIDITPAAMVVVVIYGLDPAVFVKDVMAGDLAVASPLIATELIAGGLAGILEVLTGASLGKWLLGGRILDLEGNPAGRAQRGLRAGLKLAVLLFWPLAIFALFEPRGRGIPELLTRTVVGPRPVETPEGD
ncbi:MAG: RDD family protein, partial [Planctomycetota bacterium]|nr:RDD family protein [Planctomycetota bacterium]